MNSELPQTAQREALHADITATRAELGRTLEAIAAKTQVKTRAKQAARETAAEAKQRVAAGADKARAEAATWWVQLRGVLTQQRQRLSIAAVLAGVLSAALAVVKARSKGGSKGGRRK